MNRQRSRNDREDGSQEGKECRFSVDRKFRVVSARTREVLRRSRFVPVPLSLDGREGSFGITPSFTVRFLSFPWVTDVEPLL